MYTKLGVFECSETEKTGKEKKKKSNVDFKILRYVHFQRILPCKLTIACNGRLSIEFVDLDARHVMQNPCQKHSQAYIVSSYRLTSVKNMQSEQGRTLGINIPHSRYSQI